MKDGQQIRFTGEGDQEPGIEPGDIVIVLDEKEHDVYRRSGSDLSMQMEITLVESLCGFHRVIRTLDDRDLVISALPGMFDGIGSRDSHVNVIKRLSSGDEGQGGTG